MSSNFELTRLTFASRFIQLVPKNKWAKNTNQMTIETPTTNTYK